jgi:threonine/homoserine/homoserine lactone efflux protein
LAAKTRSIGGLLALVAGLITLVLILVIAAAAGVSDNQFTQLATAAIGVVGSGVGAYYGIKVGSDQTAGAVQAQREESARAQVFAAHVTPGQEAQAALEKAFPPA